MQNWLEEMLAEIEEKEIQSRMEFDRLNASQALAAMSKLDAEIRRVNDLADEEIQIVENYRKAEVERINKKRNWILLNLEGFMRKHHEESGEKTLRLSHGQIGLRKSRDRVEISNPDVFEKVADRLSLWRTTPEKKEPDLQAIASYAKTQRIPGVTIIPGPVKFTYSTNGDTNGKAESAEIE